MPLHRETEAARRALDRFDDAIGRGRGDGESSCGLVDGLVMAAVDLEYFAVDELFPHDVREHAPGRYPYFVRDGERRGIDLMAERLVDLRRNVLRQRSAGRDVDDL